MDGGLACHLDAPAHLAPGLQVGYLLSVFQMSWMAFHFPSLSFFQVHTYLPFSLTTLPSGPLNEAS